MLDDARFRERFAFGPTPWDQGIGETVAWARKAYGPKQGGKSADSGLRQDRAAA